MKHLDIEGEIMYNIRTSNCKRKKNKMCTFIKMEYLVANAIVELYEEKQVNQVSFSKLNEYGIEVEKFLQNSITTVVLLFSREYKEKFIRDYSDLFEVLEDNVKLRDGINIDNVRNRILDYASIDLIKALFSEQAKAVLGLKK